MSACRPPSHHALDAVLDGLPADALRRATASLIEVYRSGAPPTAQVLRDPTTAAAYAAYRMPATHAAVSRALRHATDLDPGARRALSRRRRRRDRRGDVGRGRGVPRPGSARRCSTGRPTRWHWVGGSRRTARAPCVRAPRGRGCCWGRMSFCRRRIWRSRAICSASCPTRCTAPVVDALTRPARLALVIEPGTPRGYAAVLAARSRLTDAGWHLLAPVPAGRPVPGGRRHRLVPLRGAARPLGPAPAGQGRGARPRGREVLVRPRVARPGDARADARVLRHPLTRKGLVQLEVCRSDGIQRAGRGHEAQRRRVPYGARPRLGRRAGARAPVIASRENDHQYQER